MAGKSVSKPYAPMCSKCKGEKTGSHVSYCKECYNAWKRGRYAARREHEVARVMEYNKRNYDQFKEKLSEYRQKPEWKEKARAWRDSNRDKVRQYDRDKRAKRISAEGHHTKEDIRAILINQKFKCAEPTCRCDISGGKHEVDHIMPLSKGGTDWPENLQCLCKSCNSRKWAMLPEEWARKNGRLI